MVCKHCNNENLDNAKFCNECGSPLFETADNGKKAPAIKVRRKTTIIGCVLALIAVIFATLWVISLTKSDTDSMLKGTWIRDNTGITTNDTVVYNFTSKGGTNILNSEKQGQPNGETSFDWYVTEDNDLILLWSDTSCNRYVWNPDYKSYILSPNTFNWYVTNDKLYLSAPNSPTGYYLFTK